MSFGIAPQAVSMSLTSGVMADLLLGVRFSCQVAGVRPTREGIRNEESHSCWLSPLAGQVVYRPEGR